MPVSPIEDRYGSEEMRSIFKEETRFQKMLDVEAALAEALSEKEMIPKSHGRKISRKAKIKHVSVERIRELEEKTGHETMAMVLALAEVSDTASRSVHLGATSSDILDTGLALQLKEALEVVEDRIFDIVKAVVEKAKNHADTVMVGRTHGQHAVPITLGLKFALWGKEFERHLERLHEIESRVLVGQMSGAVGTGAAWDEEGRDIQSNVMDKLGLKPVDISSQIIQRDRHEELINFLGLVGGTLAKIGREIRNLQRTEISELSEPFGKEQVGSSTMPHKRNPIKSERVCGLSRILKANVQTAFENVVLEHERDLTNSAPERILFPECFLLLDQMFMDMTYVLENLTIRKSRMEKNLEITRGLNMAEAVMIELTRRGMDRQEAHKALRESSNYAIRENIPLSVALQQNSDILDEISKEEIEELLNPKEYLGDAKSIVNSVVEDLEGLEKK